MAAATETNTATLYASSPPTSPPGPSSWGLNFCCEGIPRLKPDPVEQPKNPDANGYIVKYARI